MIATEGTGSLYRFGPFVFDGATGELRKDGVRIPLQPKPQQMLQMLLENPGGVLTREELCRRLWGDDTFVDFESGLNTTANRLRLRLGDSAERPRYVETLPRTATGLSRRWSALPPRQRPSPRCLHRRRWRTGPAGCGPLWR